MRAFIGIEFSRELKDKLKSAQEIVKLNSITGRWKYIDNFHLTLKFLGEVSLKQTDSIYENMCSRISKMQSFEIGLGEAGFFRGNDCLRVVYLKILDEEGKLEGLFNIVEECCAVFGIEKERRGFTPHITIAQDVVLKSSFEELKKAADNLQSIIVPVKQVSIIKSEQIGNKRIYTRIKCCSLPY